MFICQEWPFPDKGILINNHIYIYIYIYIHTKLQPRGMKESMNWKTDIPGPNAERQRKLITSPLPVHALIPGQGFTSYLTVRMILDAHRELSHICTSTVCTSVISTTMQDCDCHIVTCQIKRHHDAVQLRSNTSMEFQLVPLSHHTIIIEYNDRQP